MWCSAHSSLRVLANEYEPKDKRKLNKSDETCDKVECKNDKERVEEKAIEGIKNRDTKKNMITQKTIKMKRKICCRPKAMIWEKQGKMCMKY